ncbi:helix-turn-helix transcriptional regulator [Chitinophaga sancti]|uniref:AraC-type DNA-binding protein n=1 Tax=Chitinophaga sancti TaxID=1004 RepID=A0A1K1T2K9_9BACT|nr:helix-turn-helix transcriptional regulator [Chitinophaga sancti]WQD59534.1 helix-turn-helix transcriptional regulator [Chitinophaga sancti]WQG88332.1 helix-turn-helix transcriptional regulator [Chitinophaga sancti]SFW90734.1 AraC-type DNA-binding protein [Chitinophaga sancti]
MGTLTITNVEKHSSTTPIPTYFTPYLLDWTAKELYSDHSKSILVQYFGSPHFYYNNYVSYTREDQPQTIRLHNPSQSMIVQIYTECHSLQWYNNDLKTKKILFTSSSEFNVSLKEGILLHLFTIEKPFLEQLIGNHISADSLVQGQLAPHKLISSKLNTILNPDSNPVQLRLKILSLIIDIISLCSKPDHSDPSAKNQTSIQNMLDEIKERIIEKPNIKDFHYSRLAKEYLSNRSTLSRGFKSAYGITLTQFLHVQLMNKAKQLLIETEMSVNEISDYLGYNQATNFSRNFFKQFRQQPHEFRK